MALRGAAPGAAFGALVGGIVGLGEAALLRASALDDRLVVYAWGALLDGGVGAALGAVVGLVALSGEGRSWRGAATGAVLTLGAATAVGFTERSTTVWPERDRMMPFLRDVVIVEIDRLPADAAVRYPRLGRFATEAVTFPGGMAAGPTRDEAWFGFLTGRLPPGQGRATPAALPTSPTFVDVLEGYGYRSLAVIPTGDPGEARVDGWLGAQVDTVVPVGRDHALGTDAATGGLLLVRALDALLPPRAQTRAARAGQAVADALGAGTQSSANLVLVELTGSDADVDLGLSRVLDAVDAAGRGTLLVVTGLRGEHAAPGDLRLGALQVSTWVRFPGRSFAGERITFDLGALTLNDALLRWSWADTFDIGDRELSGGLDHFGARQWYTRVDRPAADDAEACQAFLWSTPEWGPAVAAEGDGWVRVWRHEGYALRVAPDGSRALYEDIRDPDWTSDLSGATVITCAGVRGAARAGTLADALDAAWAASQARAGRELRPPPGKFDLLPIDPLAEAPAP